MTQFPDAESALPARTSNDKIDGDKVPVTLRVGKGTTKCGRFEVQRRHAAAKKEERRVRRGCEGGKGARIYSERFLLFPQVPSCSMEACSTRSINTVLIGSASSALALRLWAVPLPWPGRRDWAKKDDNLALFLPTRAEMGFELVPCLSLNHH